MEVCLTSRGLASLSRAVLDNGFAFLVGGNRYQCSRVLAGFISPKVAQLQLMDPFVDSFQVDIPDENKAFENVMTLMKGGSVILNCALGAYLAIVGGHLGNQELAALGASFREESLRVDDVISRLLEKREFGLDCDMEINFLAQNLFAFDSKDLSKLEINLLLTVFQNPYLRMESEGSLLHLILDLVHLNGPAFKPLFAIVPFNRLSEADMRAFLDCFEPDDMNGPIWQSLSQRLLQGVPCDAPPPTPSITRDFSCAPNNPENLHGLMHFLKSTDIGDIGFMCSGCNPQHPPELAFEMDNQDTYFESLDAPGSWIRLTFGGMSLGATHYALRSWFWPAGFQHLKSWVFEGSDDGREWTELDRREDVDELNLAYGLRRFKCCVVVECGMVRLRSIDTDHSNRSHLLILSGFEVYGHLRPRV
jgi:hypothetical protein